MKEIYSAFVKAQKAFAPAIKTHTNPAFKSRYVGLDGCVEAVLGALNDNGIALVQLTHECSDGVIVETTFIHTSGESMSGGRLHVPASKHDPQGYGSALTYARRYSLMASCGIAPEDDDGQAAAHAATKRREALAVTHRDELRAITNLAELTALYKALPNDVAEQLQAEFTKRKLEIQSA
jgi:hypothetical protein